MGTNYYFKDVDSYCVVCGRGDSDIHIGKSSAGWAFALHVYPEADNDAGTYIKDLEDWRKLFYSNGVGIYDEYGEAISPKDMMEIITERGPRELLTEEDFKEGGPYYKHYRNLRDFLALNEAYQDERGLLHARWGKNEDTYDMFDNEFS